MPTANSYSEYACFFKEGSGSCKDRYRAADAVVKDRDTFVECVPVFDTGSEIRESSYKLLKGLDRVK